MRAIIRTAIAAAVAMFAAAPALRAQGALSTLGFGYPGGQLSTRALGVGGSLADFDPQSPLNPAALVTALRASVYLQYDPEFRDVSVGTSRASTTTARFPIFGVSGRVGNANFGVSFASFLDRTWSNTYPDTQIVGGAPLVSEVTAASEGGISDARAAASYSFGQLLHVGLGVHMFPGENRVLIGRVFNDSAKAGNFTTANLISYSGSGLSLGVLAIPFPHVNLAIDGLLGGPIKARQGDSTVIGSARIPSRLGIGIAYDGVSGSAFSVRYQTQHWSDLRGLGTSAVTLFDATEFSAGAELAGPRISGVPMGVRLGYRTRTLPFGYNGNRVAERSLTGGLGIPIAGGHGTIDLGVARAARSSLDVRETGWIVSFGLAVRP